MFWAIRPMRHIQFPGSFTHVRLVSALNFKVCQAPTHMIWQDRETEFGRTHERGSKESSSNQLDSMLLKFHRFAIVPVEEKTAKRMTFGAELREENLCERKSGEAVQVCQKKKKKIRDFPLSRLVICAFLLFCFFHPSKASKLAVCNPNMENNLSIHTQTTFFHRLIDHQEFVVSFFFWRSKRGKHKKVKILIKFSSLETSPRKFSQQANRAFKLGTFCQTTLKQILWNN